MILVYIENFESAGNILASGCYLAKGLKKEIAILSRDISVNQNKVKEKTGFLDYNVPVEIISSDNKLSNIDEICEQYEISFLLLQLTENRSKYILNFLKACRMLRIPYIVYKDDFSVIDIKKVLVPITFLEEDYEKAQFASAFGRFYQAEITLLTANDYGTKANITSGKMEQLFLKFNLNYEKRKAAKDSFKVEKEAVQLAKTENYGLLILSASREYGLDDMLFGPKELHLVKSSVIPILLINPRGDLYALCD